MRPSSRVPVLCRCRPDLIAPVSTRVLSGKFRIPYFMSCDCEHLIRHMLVVDAEKRYSLAQIKQHRWLQLPPQFASDARPVRLACDSCDTLGCDADDWEDYDMALVEWIARELGLESSEAVLESVTSRAFDHFYAMYHLMKDGRGCCSAPPSPPLLPVVAAGQERKSSITTGVVARDGTAAPAVMATAGEPAAACATLSVTVSGQRRHTFGPDGTGVPTSSSQTVFTPPLLFLTPPTGTGGGGGATHNLPNADPNFPISHMDLLKPPPVLLINNTGRRASDGQATYSSMCASSMLPAAMDTVREMPPPLTCASSTTIDSQSSAQFVFPALMQLHQQYLAAASTSVEQPPSAASTPSPPAGFGHTIATPSPSPPYSCTPPLLPQPSSASVARPRKRHSLTDAPARRSHATGATDRCVVRARLALADRSDPFAGRAGDRTAAQQWPVARRHLSCRCRRCSASCARSASRRRRLCRQARRRCTAVLLEPCPSHRRPAAPCT